MKFGWSTLVCALIVANAQVALSQKRNSNGQVNINRYIDINSIPFLNRSKPLKPTFKWDLTGEVQTSMNEGLTYLDKGSILLADSSFSEVINLSKTFWPAYYYHGITQLLLGKLKGGEKDLQHAIEINPSIWESHIVLGEIYEWKSGLAGAAIEYRKASELNPASAYCVYKMGNLELRKRNLEQAENYYKKCTEIDPSFPDSYMALGIIKFLEQQDDIEALSLFENAIKSDSTFSGVYFWRGLVYLKMKDIAKCEKNWIVLLRYNPTNPFIMNTLGLLNIELNDFDQAFSYIRKALQARPIDEAWFQSGRTTGYNQIDYKLALTYILQKGYGLNDSAFANLKKGFCFLFVNEKERALHYLKRSALFEKSSVEYYVEALTWELKNMPDSAYAYYSKTVELDKDVYNAYKKRSVYHTTINDLKGACEDFDQMLRLLPNAEWIYRLRGMAKYNLKEYLDAIKDLSKVLLYDSIHFEALNTRAECRKFLGDFRGSNDDLKFLLKHPQSVGNNRISVMERIGNNYLALGDTTSAIDMFNKLPRKKTVESNIEFTKLYISVRNWNKAEEELNDGIKTTENAKKIYKQEKYSLVQLKKQGALFNLTQMLTDNSNNLLRLDLDYSNLLYLQGLMNFKKDDINESIKSLSNSLSKDPNNNEARFLRAKAYIKINDLKKASKDLILLKSQSYKDADKLLESLPKD